MTWVEPELEAIAGLVNKRTGLTFGNRHDSAESGIRRAMAKARVHGAAEYLDRLAADESALDDLVNELTVHETYFFREPAQFDLIRREILPEVKRRRGLDHVIRAWSAGCASGEEAYSLAVLFQVFGPARQHHLVATDISRAALAKARQAIFNDWSLRGRDVQLVMPHLTRDGNLYRLDDKIRSRVAFSYLNLALDAYPSFPAGVWGMDLILCRNVLIYFDRETIAKVARRLHETLAEGGWLITGAADPSLWDSAPFEVVSFPEGVFYRRPVSGPKKTVESFEDSELLMGSAGQRLPTPVWGLDAIEELQESVAGEVPSTVAQGKPDIVQDAATAAWHVRELAQLDTAAAEKACKQAAHRYPLSPDLHYLHAVLLLDQGETDNAVRAMRRVLYLDRTLAVAHFTLGAILRQRGDRAGACRAYRNARTLCAARPADEVLPLADGERAGRLAEIAGAELTLLEAS